MYTLSTKMTVIQFEAEAKIAMRRAARVEARDIRLKEMEKLQKEEEKKEKELEKDDKKTDVTVSAIGQEPPRMLQRRHTSQALLREQSKTSNHSNSSSRRGSLDSLEAEPIKSEYEEKYKKAMMTNAQLDNEKSTLMYEVDALKDMSEELEEQVHEYQREAKEKHRELQAQKRDNVGLTREVERLRELVTQRDQLIAEHGLLLGDEEESSDESGENKSKEKTKKNTQIGSIVVLSPEAAELLEVSGDGPLDVRLKRFVDERKEFVDQINKLKIELDEAKDKAQSAERRRATPTPSLNGPDMDLENLHRESARQASEYKYKLQRSEQEVATLESTVLRLEGQVRRYKSQAEESDKTEEELKIDSRRMKREIRSLTARVEELEAENTSLSKKLEKLKKKDPLSFI